MNSSTTRFQYLESLFRRQTNSSKWMAEIDGLRFIAIMGVLVTHVHGFLLVKFPKLSGVPEGVVGTMLDTAGRGVELFFVISGFILALPFARYYLKQGKRVELRAYFWRRITRLEPPYMIVMVSFFLLRAFPLVPQLASKHSFSELLNSLAASLVYGHWIMFEERPYLNVVAWSLEVEVQYYIMAPLIAFVLYKLPKQIRWISLAALIGTAPWVQEWFGLSRNTILGEYQFFLMGFALVELYLSGRELKVPAVLNGLLAGGLFFGMFALPIRETDPGNILVFCLLVFAFYVLTLSEGPLKKAMSFRPIALTGGMCYSIYLLHFQIIWGVGAITTKLRLSGGFWPNYLLQLCVLSLVILIVSTVFYLLIEKPCMDPKWPSKLKRVLLRNPSSTTEAG